MTTGANISFHDVKNIRASATMGALMLSFGGGHSVTIFMDNPNLTHHMAGIINTVMLGAGDEEPAQEAAAYRAEYIYRGGER